MKEISLFVALAVIAVLLCSCASPQCKFIATRHTTLYQESVMAKCPVPIKYRTQKRLENICT
jgi:hypothetical protein